MAKREQVQRRTMAPDTDSSRSSFSPRPFSPAPAPNPLQTMPAAPEITPATQAHSFGQWNKNQTGRWIIDAPTDLSSRAPNPYHMVEDQYKNWETDKPTQNIGTPFGPVTARHSRHAPYIQSKKEDYGNVSGEKSLNDLLDLYWFINSADDGRKQVAEFRNVAEGEQDLSDLDDDMQVVYGNLSPYRDGDYDSDDDMREKKDSEFKKGRKLYND